MKVIVLTMTIVFSFSSMGTVTVGSCPDSFEGNVKAVVGPEGSSAFSTQKVVFTNLQTLKGEVSDQVVVDILANGPFEVEAGKDYRVQLRNGKLCWIEQL